MEINSETIITLNLKNGQTEKLSVFSLSRWIGLIKAFEYIEDYAYEHNIKLDKCEFIKKPASIYEFINAKQPKIEKTILDCCNRYKIIDDSVFELI